MTTKSIYIIFFLFFTLDQTQYYWEHNVGIIGFMFSMYKLYILILLASLIVYQIVKLGKPENRIKSRILSILCGAVVIYLSYTKPQGLINFQQFEPNIVLEAKKRAGGNCNTTIKLFEDNSFKEIDRCFGSSIKRGKWKFERDTFIISEYVNGKSINEYYYKAIIKKSSKYSQSQSLIRFNNKSDTIGTRMKILINRIN